MKGITRPVAMVMPASALVPECQTITPPPNRFTHAVSARQPYYCGGTAGGTPAGELAAGAKVVLMVRGRGDRCRVVDKSGRYVLTSFRGLRAL